MKELLKINYRWPLKIGLITLIIGFIMGTLSEIVLTTSGILLSLTTLLVLLIINVLFDMIGIAVAAARIENFNSMGSKKITGSKEAIHLIKNAEKVSSFASDVIGDICGILSGSVGASIILLSSYTGNLTLIIFAAIVNGIVAALTVFGKAVGKDLAISNPDKIILYTGKIIYKTKIGRKK